MLRYDDGIADYKRFKEYGFTNSDIENLGGLCYLAINMFAEAIACFQAAAALKPDEQILNLNLAWAHYRADNTESAYKTFQRFENYLFTEFTGFKGYLGAYATVAATLYVLEPDKVEEGKIREVLTKALTHIRQWFSADGLKFVEDTLSLLRKDEDDQNVSKKANH
jgi:tetratricopeptide (TPR) repeat protein